MKNEDKQIGYKQIGYSDESGFAHDMPRTQGYFDKGKRCYGSHDWGETNPIGALIGKYKYQLQLV
ncbi:hypothetical protein [Holospora undulata]|uniref:hypothetical protein n=1 Tax=Holospora undulata TaxID=1169117 RepID=UPI00032E94F8|nr:hypothetical protein [Holospora undulata]